MIRTSIVVVKNAQYEVFAYAEHTIHGEKQKVHNNLKWTQKGRKFIYDLLSEEGVYPTIMIEN